MIAGAHVVSLDRVDRADHVFGGRGGGNSRQDRRVAEPAEIYHCGWPLAPKQNPISQRRDRCSLPAHGQIGGTQIKDHRRAHLMCQHACIEHLPAYGRSMKHGLPMYADQRGRWLAAHEFTNRRSVQQSKVAHQPRDVARRHRLLVCQLAQPRAEFPQPAADTTNELRAHLQPAPTHPHQRGVQPVDARASHAADDEAF